MKSVVTKKQPAKEKTPAAVDLNTLLPMLLDAIVERFPHDPTTPGIVLSRVNKEYYGSIARYSEQNGGGKFIAAMAYGRTLEQVVTDLGRKLTAPTALSQLKSAIWG
jgi:hypothetical protein